MTPLHIRAWLQTPVVGDFALPLDALLYYQAHRRTLGAQALSIPGAGISEGDSAARLPLRRIRIRRNGHRLREWYYAASWAVWPSQRAEGKDHWNCRFDQQLSDLIDFGERKARVELGSGPYRPYHMPVWYRHALYIDWYATGEFEDVAELLAALPGLGKKTAQGWGQVLRWEITESADDWSVRGPSGEPMRAIPVERGGILHGYRPSYWNPKNQTACITPAHPQ